MPRLDAYLHERTDGMTRMVIPARSTSYG